MKAFIRFDRNDNLFYLTDINGDILDRAKSIRLLTEKAHENGVKRVEFLMDMKVKKI